MKFSSRHGRNIVIFMKKIGERIKREWAFLKLLWISIPHILRKHYDRWLHKKAIERGTPVMVTIGYDGGKSKPYRFFCQRENLEYPEIGAATDRGIVTSVDVCFPS